MTFPELWDRYKLRYRLPEEGRLQMPVQDFRTALEKAYQAGANHAAKHQAQDDHFVRDFFRGFGKPAPPP